MPQHITPVSAYLGLLRAIGKVFETNGVPELPFEFHVGTFNQNMTRMRVIFNKCAAYDANLR
jgi:hypothetical protein